MTKKMNLTVLLFLLAGMIKTTKICPDFYMGTEKDFFNMMNNGEFSDQWNPNQPNSGKRKVVRRDAEYFYAKMPGHALTVTFKINLLEFNFWCQAEYICPYGHNV